MIFKYFSYFPSQFIATMLCLPITIFLLYHDFPEKPSSAIDPFSDSQSVQNLPVILELYLFSSNNCHSSYAIDCDQITLEFTTAAPCYFPLSLPLKDDFLLCNPKQDFRHWVCLWQIQNGDLTDQEHLWAQNVLNILFPDGFLYYGTNPYITYFAPLELSYSISLSEAEKNLPIITATPILKLCANHPVQFLQPEIFEQNGIHYWGISIIDQAGNGPCCIVIPLDRERLLQSPTWEGYTDRTPPTDPISYCIPLSGIV